MPCLFVGSVPGWPGAHSQGGTLDELEKNHLIPFGAGIMICDTVTGTRQGKIVLVQLREGADPETGERYLVKRYQSEKVESDGGAWHHFRIILKPNNPDFEAIDLTVPQQSATPTIRWMRIGI